MKRRGGVFTRYFNTKEMIPSEDETSTCGVHVFCLACHVTAPPKRLAWEPIVQIWGLKKCALLNRFLAADAAIFSRRMFGRPAAAGGTMNPRIGSATRVSQLE